MALGIADAFRDVDLPADALVDGLGGRRPLTDALAGYEQSRTEASKADYQQNLSAARFEPPLAQALELRRAARTDPSLATRMAMARAGR